MRGGLSKTLALVGAAGLLAVSACGNSDNSGSGGGNSSANKDVTVFTWWADGGEKAGLDGLVAVFGTDCTDFKFVNGAVAGGAGSNAKQVLANDLQAGNPPDTFQAHAGAELKDYINAGQVEDVSAAVQGLGAGQRLPAEPDRQPDRRRQDLLGPGQHPPGQRGLGQHDGAEEGRHRRRHRAGQRGRVDRRPGQAQGRGRQAPLAIAKDLTQVMLFESVLIADLGRGQVHRVCGTARPTGPARTSPRRSTTSRSC